MFCQRWYTDPEPSVRSGWPKWANVVPTCCTTHSSSVLVKSSQLTMDVSKANLSGPDTSGLEARAQICSNRSGTARMVRMAKLANILPTCCTTHSSFFLVKSSQLTKNGTKANRSGPDASGPEARATICSNRSGTTRMVRMAKLAKVVLKSLRPQVVGGAPSWSNLSCHHIFAFLSFIFSILMLASIFRLDWTDWTHFARRMNKPNDVPLEAF